MSNASGNKGKYNIEYVIIFVRYDYREYKILIFRVAKNTILK